MLNLNFFIKSVFTMINIVKQYMLNLNEVMVKNQWKYYYCKTIYVKSKPHKLSTLWFYPSADCKTIYVKSKRYTSIYQT